MAACIWYPSDGFFRDRKFLGVHWPASLDDLQVQWKLTSQNRWKAIEEETWHRPLASIPYVHVHPNVPVHTHTNMYMHHTHNATHTQTYTHTRAHTHFENKLYKCIFCLWDQAQKIFLAWWYYMCEATRVIYVYVHIYGPMLSAWRPRCGIHGVAAVLWEHQVKPGSKNHIWVSASYLPTPPLAEAGHMALSVTKNRGKAHLHTENWKYRSTRAPSCESTTLRCHGHRKGRIEIT